MGRTQVLSLLALLGSLGSVNAMAQSWQTGLDINFNETEPREYEFCDYDAEAKSSLKHYQACNWGLDDARRMAERFGADNGRIQGFYRGYAFGANKMYEAYQSNGEAMAQGKASVGALGSYFESGLQEGITKGRTEGQADGSSQARVRFERAVDTGSFPSNSFTVPQKSYTPEGNAYYKLVPSSLRVPTNIDDIIKNKDKNELDALKVSNFPVYSQYNAKEYGEIQPLTLWDLWCDDGMYAFSKAYWYDNNRAWTVWQGSVVDTKPRYNSLASVDTGVTAVDPATGATTVVMQDLRPLFSRAFRQAYAYYINYYFAKEYKRGAELGQTWGESIGVQLGKRVAFGKGLVAEFNTKFVDSAKKSFFDSYSGAFSSGFTSTFEDYARNPKLQLTSATVVGVDEDGIIQPGERVKVRYTLRNVGGVGTQTSARLFGDIVESYPFASSIDRLVTRQYTSEVMAKMDPRLGSGSVARLSLDVSGAKFSFNQDVTKLVRIVGSPSVEVESLAGLSAISVVVRNMSTVATPASIGAVAYIDGKIVAESNIGTMGPGQQTTMALNIRDLDPLKLINDGLRFAVEIKLADTVLETVTGTMGSDAPLADLLSYFNQLANESELKLVGVSSYDRLITVFNQIVTMNIEDVKEHKKGKNVYKRNPEITVIGKVLAMKKASVQSKRALEVYDAIGRAFYTKSTRTILPIFLGMGRRRSYENMCEELTLNGKLDDKGKHTPKYQYFRM